MRTKPAGSAALKATWSSAWSGLRMYWGTAVIAGVTGAVALAAILPVLWLARSGEGPVSRLMLEHVPGWSLAPYIGTPARAPEETQQHALALLFGMLLGAALVTLVLALITVMSVSAARASQRVTEVAVRRAVGASRMQLLLAALAEGSVVAIAMSVVGGALGAGAAYVALAGWPGTIGSADARPAIAALAALVAGTILGALFTLLAARRRRVTESTARPLQLHFAALQLGFSLIALTGGTMLVQHAGTHATASTDAAASGAGTGQVWRVTSGAIDPAERSAQYASMLEQLRGQQGIETASLTSVGAHVGLATVGVLETDCGLCSENNMMIRFRSKPSRFALVSADTFKTVGARVIGGRGITAADTYDAPHVAVVSRGLAEQQFQNGQPLGRQIMVYTDRPNWYTVVGIVDDPKPTAFGGSMQTPYGVYLSVLQHPAPTVELLVRGPQATAAGSVLARMIGSAGAMVETSEAAVIAAQVAPLAWFGRWMALEGWAMLIIAGAGTFVLMRLWVRTIRAELGVRRATGARRIDIFLFIMPRALGTGLAGVAIALWLGPSIWGVMSGTIEGLRGWDAAVFARFALLLVGTALTGALLPAWSAAHAPPSSLLGTTGE